MLRGPFMVEKLSCTVRRSVEWMTRAQTCAYTYHDSRSLLVVSSHSNHVSMHPVCSCVDAGREGERERERERERIYMLCIVLSAHRHHERILQNRPLQIPPKPATPNASLKSISATLRMAPRKASDSHGSQTGRTLRAAGACCCSACQVHGSRCSFERPAGRPGFLRDPGALVHMHPK